MRKLPWKRTNAAPEGMHQVCTQILFRHQLPFTKQTPHCHGLPQRSGDRQPWGRALHKTHRPLLAAAAASLLSALQPEFRCREAAKVGFVSTVGAELDRAEPRVPAPPPARTSLHCTSVHARAVAAAGGSAPHRTPGRQGPCGHQQDLRQQEQCPPGSELPRPSLRAAVRRGP